MALVGGGTGGASNTVNPTGTGSSLNYIGNHAYAWSGFADFDDNETTFLQFTTGNEYSILQLMPTRADAGLSADSQTRVYVNSEKVFNVIHKDGNRPAETAPYNILIPSFSKVQITMINTTNTTTLNGAVMLTGRVYA